MKHKDSWIWLRSRGCVVGVNLEYINSKIDYFNHNQYLRENADFWEWLSWEEGEPYYGFSPLWNDGNPLFSKVHFIRGRYHK